MVASGKGFQLYGVSLSDSNAGVLLRVGLVNGKIYRQTTQRQGKESSVSILSILGIVLIVLIVIAVL